MTKTKPLTRPVMRYHGGKWKLAPWVLSFFPEHRIYVEPFGGAASLLMRKKRSYAEVYNDRESGIVNVFRVLRDPESAAELCRLIELTPFARDEFLSSYKPGANSIERARSVIVRAYIGFGSASMTRTHKTGFRSKSNRSGTTPATDWRNYPEHIAGFTDRLRGVVIENKDALEVMQQHDTKETLHYVDPPYVWETRSSKKNSRHCYEFELTDLDHEKLAEQLHALRGMVILSGYPCPLYDDKLYKDWDRYNCKHFADGAAERTEVLWINKACADKLSFAQKELSL